MRRALTKPVLVSVALGGICLLQCGVNPFGPGESGLKLFAHLGKAISKPSVVNDEQGSKKNSKEAVGHAQGQMARLPKTANGTLLEDPPWLIAKGIADSGSGVFAYYEQVRNKPSDEDADKLVTGRGEIKFRYAGIPTLGTIDLNKITAILSFEMIGREFKKWNQVTDSVRIKIAFAHPEVLDFTPGSIALWGKNISALQVKGAGDTAAFVLDSLDEINHVQYGEGHFLDAHTGRLHDGDPRAFDFTIQVIHKNTVDPNKPYERYQDNEGIVTFYLPWNKSDSLYFSVHFFPHHYRTGTVQKNSPSGPVLVKFEYNDKEGIGEATYYNSKGEVIETEQLGTGGI